MLVKEFQVLRNRKSARQVDRITDHKNSTDTDSLFRVLTINWQLKVPFWSLLRVPLREREERMKEKRYCCNVARKAMKNLFYFAAALVSEGMILFLISVKEKVCPEITA